MIWFQDLENSSCLHTWEGFVQALIIKFGPSSYDNPMEILTRLRQNDSVKAYKGQFETLSNRLGSLFENYKLSCFLSGLKDEIKLPVRMFNPPNLITAYGLAKIQEEYVLLNRKPNKGLLPTPSSYHPSPQYPNTSSHNPNTSASNTYNQPQPSKTYPI